MDVLENKKFFYGPMHPSAVNAYQESMFSDDGFANFLFFGNKKKRAEKKIAKAEKALAKGNDAKAERKLDKAEKLAPGSSLTYRQTAADTSACYSVTPGCYAGGTPTGKNKADSFVGVPDPNMLPSTTPTAPVAPLPLTPPQQQYPYGYYPPMGGGGYCMGATCGSAACTGSTSTSDDTKNMLMYGAFGLGALAIVILIMRRSKAAKA